MAETLKLKIAGMSCNHCVRSIESGLREIDGILEVKVNLQDGSASVLVKESSAGLLMAISAKVKDLGYEVKP